MWVLLSQKHCCITASLRIPRQLSCVAPLQLYFCPREILFLLLSILSRVRHKGDSLWSLCSLAAASADQRAWLLLHLTARLEPFSGWNVADRHASGLLRVTTYYQHTLDSNCFHKAAKIMVCCSFKLPDKHGTNYVFHSCVIMKVPSRRLAYLKCGFESSFSSHEIFVLMNRRVAWLLLSNVITVFLLLKKNMT